MAAGVTEHGISGYRKGCHCEVCRTAKREYMRAWRVRRAAAAEPTSAAAPVVEPREPVATPPALDLTADPGAIEQALATDVEAPAGEVLWSGTLLAMARLNARVMDQVHQSDRLDLVSPLQLRMLEILNRMAFAKTAGLLGNGQPTGTTATGDEPGDDDRARELLNSLDGPQGG